jgi:hypothetical protein
MTKIDIEFAHYIKRLKALFNSAQCNALVIKRIKDFSVLKGQFNLSCLFKASSKVIILPQGAAIGLK